MNASLSAPEIAARLATQAEGVCRELLPGGRVLRGEYEAEHRGEAGHRLKARLEGPKAGVWRDFASSDKQRPD